jgi:two-component system, OmpR family, phosphate regulon response regulator PhoB
LFAADASRHESRDAAPGIGQVQARWPKLLCPEPHLSPSPFHILLVEDEPVIQELVRSLLSDEPVEVSCAGNGVEGLKLARSRPFDLILLDVVLPLLDGISVCRMLKSDAATARTPLYMLTGTTKRSDVESATRAGADGYIHKPFRGAELMAVIDRLRAR